MLEDREANDYVNGMATEDEIAEAADAARSAGCTELVLLHCISSYPAPIDQANVRQLAELARCFDVMLAYPITRSAQRLLLRPLR